MMISFLYIAFSILSITRFVVAYRIDNELFVKTFKDEDILILYKGFNVLAFIYNPRYYSIWTTNSLIHYYKELKKA